VQPSSAWIHHRPVARAGSASPTYLPGWSLCERIATAVEHGSADLGPPSSGCEIGVTLLADEADGSALMRHALGRRPLEALQFPAELYPGLGAGAVDLRCGLHPARIVERADRDHHDAGHHLRLVHD
jgi:hypothetical protein